MQLQRLVDAHRPDDDRQVLAVVGHTAKADDEGVTAAGRQNRLRYPSDLRFGAPPVRRKVRGRNVGKSMLIGELGRLGATGHLGGVIAGYDVAQRPCLPPTSKPGQVERSLGRSRVSEHSPSSAITGSTWPGR